MIALDTNPLVYAHRRDSPRHEHAARRIRDVAEGSASWAIPWPCLHEFLAIVTDERVYRPPSPMSKALDQIKAWLESPSLILVSETDGSLATLMELVATARITGPRIHDARIAALCLHANVRELLRADRDFSRFGALKTRNPLMRA